MKAKHYAYLLGAAALWVIGSAVLIQVEKAKPDVDWVIIYATPVIWLAVIGLPIAAHHEWKAKRAVIAAILMFAGIIGSAYMLNGTIGRQAELRDTKSNEADQSAKPNELLTLELKEAKAAKANALKKGEKACKADVDSDACNYWTGRENAADRLIKSTVAQMGAAPAVKPKASGEKLVTTAIVLINHAAGGDVKADVVSIWVATFGPALLGFFLELGTIGLAGAAFPVAAQRAVSVVSKEIAPTKLEAEPVPALPVPVPSASVPAIAAPTIDPDVASVVLAFKGRKDAKLTNGEIAEAMGVVKSESSKRVTNALAAGVVTKEVVGREVQIALRA